VVDLGSFFGAAFADAFTLPERRVEVVGVGDFALGLAAGQIVDVVAGFQFAAAGVFSGQGSDAAEVVVFDPFADQAVGGVVFVGLVRCR
jgi:hypothetical protein